jgi:hypothetical protein
MGLELDNRVACVACGLTVWEADCIDGFCSPRRWTGERWEPGCAAKYYAWVRSRMSQFLQPDGSLLSDGSVEVSIDAWLEAGTPNVLPPVEP